MYVDVNLPTGSRSELEYCTEIGEYDDSVMVFRRRILVRPGPLGTSATVKGAEPLCRER